MKTKKHFLAIAFFILVVGINACSDDTKTETPKPVPTPDFTFTGAGGFAPATVTFTNTSTNATSYAWDFTDGGTSTDASPTHLFATGGSYNVRMTATSEGVSATKAKIVVIKAKPTSVKITKVTLNAAPFVDGGGSPWDPSDGPDLFYNITDQTNTVLRDGSGAVLPNIASTALPVSWTLTTPFEITTFTASRFIDLWDDDTADADDFIGGVGFLMNDYISGANAYPSSVSKTVNGNLTVTLYLTWQ